MPGTEMFISPKLWPVNIATLQRNIDGNMPAKKLSKDPRSDAFRRHHVLESGLQKAVKIAVDRAGITKRVGTHTLRHSFATHLLEDGVNIRVVQELMGHADAKTTEIYTHVMEKDIQAVSSPLETL